MSIDLKGKLYRDMSEQYRDAVSKKDFKEERRSQNRMAGDALTSDYFPDGAPIMDPDKDNIYSYDTSAFGAGSQKDPSVKRLSKADLKNLRNQDYSLEDIVDYADNIGETGVITDGGAAQRLLDRYRKKLSKNEPGDGDPIDFIDDPDPTLLPEIIDDEGDPPIIDVPDIIGPPGVDIGDFIPSPGTNINQGNSLLQSIIQDNDVNSVVSGNGNTTTINQNNAANNYGGNQYNFARIPGYYS